MKIEEVIKIIKGILIDFIEEELKTEHTCFKKEELSALETLLLVYEKEREKNKDLEKTLKQTQNSWYGDTQKIEKQQKEIEALKLIHESYKEMIEENNFISKDKIKAKIEEVDKEIKECEFDCNKCLLDNQCISFKEKEFLQSLLEEKEGGE